MPGKRKTFYDWKIYNKQLVDRGKKLAGQIKTIKTSVIQFWDMELDQLNEGKIGAPYEYPNSMIVFFAIIRSAFNINSYRNLEGLCTLFFDKVPDYTRMQRRIKKLDVDTLMNINREATRAKTKDRIIKISIDGTGIQINGKYVWEDNKEKKVRKRDWRKISIAVDTETRQIVGIKILGRYENEGSHENTVELMENTFENIHDSSIIDRVHGDGGFDNEDNFDLFQYLGITPIIRIRKPSREKAEQMSRALNTKKKRKFFSSNRNKIALEQFDWEGYVGKNGYGKRSGVEGIIGSFKRFFRENLFSRIDGMIEREIMTRVLIWNMIV